MLKKLKSYGNRHGITTNPNPDDILELLLSTKTVWPFVQMTPY